MSSPAQSALSSPTDHPNIFNSWAGPNTIVKMSVSLRHDAMSLANRMLTHAWILSSSGILCSVDWFRTDISGLRFGPIFKGQDVQKQASTLHNIPDEDRTQVNHGGSPSLLDTYTLELEHEHDSFLSCPEHPDRLWDTPNFLYNGYRSTFLEVKRHSPPSQTEVKTEWNYTSAPPTCLHDVTIDYIFAFTLPRNIKITLPTNTVPYPRRMESSTTSLGKCRNSHKTTLIL